LHTGAVSLTPLSLSFGNVDRDVFEEVICKGRRCCRSTNTGCAGATPQ
jgi:hypothetical protein